MKTIKNKLSIENYDSEPVSKTVQNKYLRQIAPSVAKYIFEFNRLEDSVARIAAEQIDGGSEKNEFAYIFLTGMTFNQKVELLERFYTFHIDEINPSSTDKLKGDLRNISATLKSVGKTRNTIVHANYYSLDKNGNIKEKTRYAGSDVEENWVSITREYLMECIDQMVRLAEKIEEFDEDFNDAIFFRQ